MRSQPGFWQTLSRVQVPSTIAVKTIPSRRASAPSTPPISGAKSARPSLLKAMVRGASFDTRLSSLSAFWSVMPPDCTDKRSEEHTSELQSQSNLVCRLLLEKKKTKKNETERLLI